MERPMYVLQYFFQFLFYFIFSLSSDFDFKDEFLFHYGKWLVEEDGQHTLTFFLGGGGGRIYISTVNSTQCQVELQQ